MHWFALVGLLAACGRLGFDTSSSDAATPELSVFEPIVLPPGGDGDGVAITPTGEVYAWFQQGVFRSADAGASWTECERRAANHVAATPSGGVALAADDDVYISDDGCTTWQATGLRLRTLYVRTAGARLLAGTTSGLYAFDGAWNLVPSPFDGTAVVSIASDATGSTLLIGSGVGSGVARSTNGGVGWTVQNTGLVNGYVFGLAIAPSAVNRAYAVEKSAGGSTGAFFRSDDGGVTWMATFGNGGGNPDSVAVDPTNADRVLFANYNQLLISENGGVGWSDGRAPEMEVSTAHGFAFDAAGAVFAATGRGIFRGTFPGPVWAERDTGIDAWEIEDIATTATSTFFATTSGVIRTLVGGPHLELVSAGSVYDSETDAVLVLANGSLLTAGGRHVRISTNDGASYSTAYDVGSANNYTTRALARNGDRAFVATATQTAYSDPPYTSWTNVQIAGQARSANHIVVRADGSVVVVASNGVFESLDNGLSFVALAGAPANGRRGFEVGALLLVGTADGLWAHDAVGWTRRGLDSTIVEDLLVAAGTWIAATSGGVRVSRDDGETWSSLPGLDDRRPQRLAIDLDGSLLVGTDGSGLFHTPMP